MAISLLLLIVAALFVHSFQKLTKAGICFDHDHLMMFDVDAVAAGYKGAGVMELYRQLNPSPRGGSRRAFRIDLILGPSSHSESGDQISIEGYTPNRARKWTHCSTTLARDIFRPSAFLF